MKKKSDHKIVKKNLKKNNTRSQNYEKEQKRRKKYKLW